MRLSLLIPVYGSAAILEEGYHAFRAAATEAVGDDFEVVYLVDGSLDDSRAILARIAAHDPRVRVFDRPRAEGLGATLRELFVRGTGEVLVYFDADAYKCFDLALLPVGVEGVSRADVVVMSRYHRRAKMPPIRRVASHAHWLLCRLAFGVRVRDLGSGFVVFRRSAVRDLHLNADGFEIHAELFAELHRTGRRVIEQPASYTHWDGGAFAVLEHGPALLRGIAGLWWARGSRTRRRAHGRASSEEVGGSPAGPSR